MNLSIIAQNHAADPEIGFLTKSISKSYGRATAMSPAWELILKRKMKIYDLQISKKTRLEIANEGIVIVSLFIK